MMKFKYFKYEDFACSHTGRNKMNPEFIEKLDQLREVCGFPFVITSGFRDPSHPIEEAKVAPGIHTKGIAADIAANSVNAYIIMKHAYAMGFTGIARGKSFVHLDIRDTIPVTWSY